MLTSMKNLSDRTTTENGAAAYRNTGSDCLNFFAVCGALRCRSDREIIRLFLRAYAEDPDMAMRALFYTRDIRGGLGERRVFTVILRWLAETHPRSVQKNLANVAEYGRFDDLLVLLDTPLEEALGSYLRHQLAKDLEAMAQGRSVSLLAKWLPSVNTSSPDTRDKAWIIRQLLGMGEKKYRRTLSSLRRYIDILETRMCERDYSFRYRDLPGQALFRHRKAMLRNDETRYKCYLRSVAEGKEHMNASVLYPYEIVREALNEPSVSERSTLDAAWNALPDYTDNRNALVVVDGSGSMYWEYGGSVIPAYIALSLGIYFAEHSTGYFANHFITFSETPQLVKLQGGDIVQKVQYCESFDEVANTDFNKVFALILDAAVQNHLPQSQLPEYLYIISDMEFDKGIRAEDTVHENARRAFAEQGYQLPKIVYWNAASRNDQYPVRMDEHGTALVSGASPALFRQMMEQDMTPCSMMEFILNSKRYRDICA